MKRVLAMLLVLSVIFQSFCLIGICSAGLNWVTSTADEGYDLNVGESPSLALDANGNPHISYCESTNYNLKFAEWNGSSWIITTVDSSYWVGLSSSLALDSVGNPHISYYDYQNSDLKFAEWIGSDWIKTIVDYNGSVGSSSSLALDANGNPHISYYDFTNTALKFAERTGSSWNLTTVDSALNVGSSSSLALDANGNPHISYSDTTNYDLKFAEWTGSSWAKTTVDSTGNVGTTNSLALDSIDKPHISYYDSTNWDLKFAEWNGSSWIKTTVASTGDVGSDSSLVLGVGNNPRISYYDRTNGYLKFTQLGFAGFWITETVDNAGDVGLYSSMALDASGNPAISYYDHTNLHLKFAKWSGSSWIISTVDSSHGDTGEFTSLALDSAGNPHISYRDFTTRSLMYAKWTGSSWAISRVDTGDVGYSLSLALDEADNPHISYFDNWNGSLRFAEWNGSGWATSTIDTTPPGETQKGLFSSLALDANGNPHVSYRQWSPHNLWFAEWTGSTWDISLVHYPVDGAASLALDASGNPHISYFDAVSQNLKLAELSGSSWVKSTIDPAGPVGSQSSLAFDNSGIPHIGYYDNANSSLKYAEVTNSSWSISTVDSVGEVGNYPSLALDASGNPHISYMDYSNRDLKYAKWTGSSWVISTLDTAGDVGAYTSLALDASGNPHISYYDKTNGDLKYAHGEDVTPPTGSVTVNSGATYATSRTVILTLSAFDEDSGVASVRFAENQGSWTSWYPYVSSFMCTLNSTGDGQKQIDVQFKDYAGQTSSPWTIFDYIILDTTPPFGSIYINNGTAYATTIAVHLNLSATDYANSGVSAYCLSNDNITYSSWQPYADSGPPLYTVSVPWTLSAGDGLKTVYVKFKDNAGLTSPAYYDNIVLDSAPPTGLIVINNGNPTATSTRSVTLYMSSYDATSGVYQVRYGNEGEPWGAWEAPAASKAWTLTAGAGLKTIYFQIKDNAGLVSTMYSDTITLVETFGLEQVTGWYWTDNTQVNCVASGDVDSDGVVEIVTGGSFFDGARNVAQLIVRSGSTLTVEDIQCWYWTGNTTINSVAVGDADTDGRIEVVTGGTFHDGSRNVAQLIEWDIKLRTVERIQCWYWTGNTVINSVAIADVDMDQEVEVVTGGYFNDGSRNVAQLILWNGANLFVDRLTNWYWTNNTVINSVALGDVNADGSVEVVSGGYFNDNTRNVAQLIEWRGANLAVDRIQCWYWTSNTAINSVAVGDADADDQVEVVTGGHFNDNTRDTAQLIEWNGADLAVERIQCWYWTGNTAINSVGVGDVDDDAQVEVVTGGYFNDNTRNVAQLINWDGATLTVDNINAWYWTGNTVINFVLVSDVDGDAQNEVATGGYFNDNTRNIAQQIVWGMT